MSVKFSKSWAEGIENQFTLPPIPTNVMLSGVPVGFATGTPLNPPANLAVAYAALADLRGLPVEQLPAQVAENFARLFGSARL